MRVLYRDWKPTPEMKQAVLEALDRGEAAWHSKADVGVKFEKEFATYAGTKYAVAVSSCAGALHIAMAILEIKPNDEVISSANVFTAATDYAVMMGAKPVFTDIDPDTYTIDVNQLEDKITSRTKAIIPVHMNGHPTDMDPIMKIAEDHGIPVIEDVAQAAGSKYKGKKSGSMGHFNMFSFAGKSITCFGEGGMITTNNEEYAKKAMLYRHFGHHPDHYGEASYVVGFNYVMSGWAFTLGRIQLKHLDEYNRKRRANAKMYEDLLGKFSEVKLPVEKDWAYHVYLHYNIEVDRRDELREFLKKKEIDTKVIYSIPTHLQPSYKDRFGFKTGMYPATEKSTKRIISLPTDFNLGEEHIHYVSDAVKEFYH